LPTARKQFKKLRKRRPEEPQGSFLLVGACPPRESNLKNCESDDHRNRKVLFYWSGLARRAKAAVIDF